MKTVNTTATETLPQISFFMTVRNGERYVFQALESIKAQDVNCWEAVIVDDGSSDSTVSILESFSAVDPRFRVEYTSWIGRGKALNKAISLCRAEILTNLDADDLSHPQRARLLLSEMEQHPEFAVLAGRCQIIFEAQQPTWILDQQSISSYADVTQQLARTNPIAHSTVGVRRNVLMSVGGYDEERVSQFDYDLWVRLALAGNRVGLVDAILGAKRTHSGQSFERNGHFFYAVRAANIQWRAICGLRANKIIGLVGLAAHLLWAFVPVKVRMWVRRAGFLSNSTPPD